MPTSPFSHITYMENSPTSFARNSVVVGSNDFKFGTETHFVVLLAMAKFGTNRS